MGNWQIQKELNNG